MMIHCKDCRWWNRAAVADLKECILIGGYSQEAAGRTRNIVFLGDGGWFDTGPEFGCILGQTKEEDKECREW